MRPTASLRVAFAAAALVASGCAPGRLHEPRRMPTVVFMSDFGTADDSVALCKGVMLGIEPFLRIVDLSHDVTPYSIRDGARFLAGAAPHFPARTVFVAVVDPGVGGTRKPIVARSRRGQLFVLPDNGLLTLVADAFGLEAVREITRTGWMHGAALSSTFHGRDIFSPVGARLARGARFEDVGPTVTQWVRLDVTPARLDDAGLSGEIVGLDGPYGNLMTNVDAALFAQLGHVRGDTVEVRVGGETLRVPYVRTFSDVPAGRPLLYIDSRGRIGLAINLGNFAKDHDVEPPTPFEIRRK